MPATNRGPREGDAARGWVPRQAFDELLRGELLRVRLCLYTRQELPVGAIPGTCRKGLPGFDAGHMHCLALKQYPLGA